MVSTHSTQHTTPQDNKVKDILNDYIDALEIIRDCDHCRVKLAELRK